MQWNSIHSLQAESWHANNQQPQPTIPSTKSESRKQQHDNNTPPGNRRIPRSNIRNIRHNITSLLLAYRALTPHSINLKTDATS